MSNSSDEHCTVKVRIVYSKSRQPGLAYYIYICLHATFIDDSSERVWPIKVSDGVRVTLFNKGPATSIKVSDVVF